MKVAGIDFGVIAGVPARRADRNEAIASHRKGTPAAVIVT
jgi:hypothetical protein